jgi:hypothetical protein
MSLEIYVLAWECFENYKCEIILQGRKLDFKHLFYNNLADELSVTNLCFPTKLVI